MRSLYNVNRWWGALLVFLGMVVGFLGVVLPSRTDSGLPDSGPTGWIAALMVSVGAFWFLFGPTKEELK